MSDTTTPPPADDASIKSVVFIVAMEGMCACDAQVCLPEHRLAGGGREVDHEDRGSVGFVFEFCAKTAQTSTTSGAKRALDSVSWVCVETIGL